VKNRERVPDEYQAMAVEVLAGTLHPDLRLLNDMRRQVLMTREQCVVLR
jgi:hypothetical protein